MLSQWIYHELFTVIPIDGSPSHLPIVRSTRWWSQCHDSTLYAALTGGWSGGANPCATGNPSGPLMDWFQGKITGLPEIPIFHWKIDGFRFQISLKPIRGDHVSGSKQDNHWVPSPDSSLDMALWGVWLWFDLATLLLGLWISSTGWMAPFAGHPHIWLPNPRSTQQTTHTVVFCWLEFWLESEPWRSWWQWETGWSGCNVRHPYWSLLRGYPVWGSP